MWVQEFIRATFIGVVFAESEGLICQNGHAYDGSFVQLSFAVQLVG